VLFGLVSDTPISVSLLLCQAIDANATAPEATPIFFGSIIAGLFSCLEIEPNKDMTMGTPSLPANLEYCRTLNLVGDFPGGQVRFIDTLGRIWDPNDPDMDIDEHPAQQQQQSPARQPPADRPSSSTPGAS
jgi:hypothetical protein